VCVQCLPEPVKRLRCDIREPPTGRRAIGPGADLDHFLAAPTADLLLAMPADRIHPIDPPRLNCSIPDAHRAAIHVIGPIHIRSPIRMWRHDPDVLYGPPIQYPSEVGLPLKAEF